ncbi:hypothetical protein TNCV_2679351 [Trichonephila clavipes]|nr:hypothetical protein TNCV_2679351 [Trichonephila clavipes]
MVVVLVALKTRRVEEVVSRYICRGSIFSRWYSVVVKRRGVRSGVVLITCPRFKITRFVVSSPPLQCDVNITLSLLEHFKGLGSNHGEDMDVRKCIGPLRQGGWGTLNIHRAACPLVWLVEGEETWETSDQPKVFSL